MTLGITKPEADYRNLIVKFLPRVIHNEDEYITVQTQVDRLVDRTDLTSAEQEYLDLLGTLIWEYEQRTESSADYELRGVTLLRGLIELHELKQQDLVPIFKTKSIVSAVLNGKRQLTTEHINQLAAFFHLPHGLFFEPLQVQAPQR